MASGGNGLLRESTSTRRHPPPPSRSTRSRGNKMRLRYFGPTDVSWMCSPLVCPVCVCIHSFYMVHTPNRRLRSYWVDWVRKRLICCRTLTDPGRIQWWSSVLQKKYTNSPAWAMQYEHNALLVLVLLEHDRLVCWLGQAKTRRTRLAYAPRYRRENFVWVCVRVCSFHLSRCWMNCVWFSFHLFSLCGISWLFAFIQHTVPVMFHDQKLVWCRFWLWRLFRLGSYSCFFFFSNHFRNISQGLIRFWPWSCSSKQVLFLNELEDVLELLMDEQVSSVRPSISAQLRQNYQPISAICVEYGRHASVVFRGDL